MVQTQLKRDLTAIIEVLDQAIYETGQTLSFTLLLTRQKPLLAWRRLVLTLLKFITIILRGVV